MDDDEFAIHCPRCRSEATFRRPFSILNPWQSNMSLLEAAEQDSNKIVTRWSGWYIIVHAPDLWSWVEPAPDAGYQASA